MPSSLRSDCVPFTVRRVHSTSVMARPHRCPQLWTTMHRVRPTNRSTAPARPDNVPGGWLVVGPVGSVPGCQVGRDTPSLERSGCAAVRTPGRAWSATLASPPGHRDQAVEEVGVETYVPAQQSPSCPQARLSRPDEHSRRARRAQEPARQGPRSPVGLTNRIRERDAFERLRRDGTRVHSTSLWCNFLSDPVMTPSCTAFAIGRAFGSAVARNRFRRRLRALLMTRQRSNPLPPGLLLIGARPGAAELTFDQLRAELDLLLDRLPRCP